MSKFPHKMRSNLDKFGFDDMSTMEGYDE